MNQEVFNATNITLKLSMVYVSMNDAVITSRACARGKVIPSVRLSVCLSVVCKKNFQISYKQILLRLIIVS